MQQSITTRVQAEATVDRIESIILGIIDNITNRVSLDIVLQRLAYLKTELAKADCMPAVYNDVTELLVYVIEQITNNESLDIVLNNLLAIQTNMVDGVQVADDILLIQSTLIGIVENIINKVGLDIILVRLDYVKRLIANAMPGSC